MIFKNKPPKSNDNSRLVFFNDKNSFDNDFALFVGTSKDI